MKALLLVTWIIPGQAMSSYQVPFATITLCREAAQSLKADASKLSGETGSKAYQISALCVAQNSN